MTMTPDNDTTRLDRGRRISNSGCGFDIQKFLNLLLGLHTESTASLELLRLSRSGKPTGAVSFDRTAMVCGRCAPKLS